MLIWGGSLGLAILLVTVGCATQVAQRNEIIESNLDQGSLVFALQPVSDTNGKAWLGVYESRGATAKFRIELGESKVVPDSPSWMEMSSGRGRFVAQPGSNAEALIADLAVALRATVAPGKERSGSIEFEFVNLGGNGTRNSDGSYSVSAEGDWTNLKLFLGSGDNEGEVFLNLNESLRVAEFAIKDPDYRNFLLTELARVL